jgi:hypothetical protein
MYIKVQCVDFKNVEIVRLIDNFENKRPDSTILWIGICKAMKASMKASREK